MYSIDLSSKKLGLSKSKMNMTYLAFICFFMISKFTGGNEMEVSNFFSI